MTFPSEDNAQIIDNRSLTLVDLQRIDLSKPVWLKLYPDQLNLLSQAQMLGFEMHHCNKNHILLHRGMEQRPKFATHGIGAGSAVMNRHNEILLIQESQGMAKGMWGLPGGHVDPREFAVKAAVREVWEEVGLRVEAVDFLMLIENPKSHFDKGNLYMVFLMKLRGEEQKISLCPKEIQNYAWVNVKGLKEVVPFAKKNRCTGTIKLLDSYYSLLERRNLKHDVRYTEIYEKSPKVLVGMVKPRL